LSLLLLLVLVVVLLLLQLLLLLRLLLLLLLLLLPLLLRLYRNWRIGTILRRAGWPLLIAILQVRPRAEALLGRPSEARRVLPRPASATVRASASAAAPTAAATAGAPLAPAAGLPAAEVCFEYVFFLNTAASEAVVQAEHARVMLQAPASALAGPPAASRRATRRCRRDDEGPQAAVIFKVRGRRAAAAHGAVLCGRARRVHVRGEARWRARTRRPCRSDRRSRCSFQLPLKLRRLRLLLQRRACLGLLRAAPVLHVSLP
jgi:hypothetical protein